MKTRSMISFDWAMKRLLRQKANFEILEGFLSELLHRKISIKYIGESEGLVLSEVEVTKERIVVDSRNNGFSLEQIQLITQLTAEQINEILKR